MTEFWSVVACWLSFLILRTAWACPMVPIVDGKRLPHTKGQTEVPSLSAGQCTAQCYRKDDCTGANYLAERKVCEMLTLSIRQEDVQDETGSTFITIYRDVEAGTIRLADGASYRDGRVEIYLNDKWGTICEQDWDDVDAGVVCRQLEFCEGIARPGTLYPSEGRPMHLHAVSCDGSEETIDRCSAGDGPGTCENKLTTRGAGVFCKECNVRLVNGDSPNKGRVEVMVDGNMGTVCNSNWDDHDANVVCRELGYCYGSVKSSGLFGAGTGPIHLANIRCKGREFSLLDCATDKQEQHSCTHEQDASVECEHSFPCIRLMNGTDKMSGRVEVFMDNSWGTICDDSWKTNSAKVVCRELGFCGGTSKKMSFFGSKYGDIHMDDVVCIGDELTLFRCPRKSTIHNCGQIEDAAVICNAC